MRIISGKYGRRRFPVPTNITARPTTDMARESLFNLLATRIDLEQCHALDLFAGTGAISFEFLSRGCLSVTCVEQAATQWKFITKVKNILDDPNITVVRGDAFKFIASCHRSFDIIFADPPYDHPRFAEIPQLILDSDLVTEGTMVIIEHSKVHDFSSIPQFTEHRAYGKMNFSFLKA